MKEKSEERFSVLLCPFLPCLTSTTSPLTLSLSLSLSFPFSHFSFRASSLVYLFFFFFSLSFTQFFHNFEYPRIKISFETRENRRACISKPICVHCIIKRYDTENYFQRNSYDVAKYVLTYIRICTTFYRMHTLHVYIIIYI